MNVAIGAPVERFIPPADIRITTLDLWVQVFDRYVGERLRPYGSDLEALTIYFKYAE